MLLNIKEKFRMLVLSKYCKNFNPIYNKEKKRFYNVYIVIIKININKD
jgi:hypothetical protein